MKNSKQREMHELIYKFGLLMQPLEELVKSNESAPFSSYQIAMSKIQGGESGWNESIKEFCRFGPDLFFDLQFRDLLNIPSRCRRSINQYLKDQSHYKQTFLQPHAIQTFAQGELSKAKNEFEQAIYSIPIEWEPEIFEANTPFTSYVKVKQVIMSAKSRIYYFDRYLKKEFFDLFLFRVNRNVRIRLVTTKGKRGNKPYGVEDVTEVSRLASVEFVDYQLIEVDYKIIHDRNLWIDDLNFSLGPGIDKAGFSLTNFGPTDSSPEALAQIEDIISNGQVIT